MGSTPTADSTPELADLIRRGRLIPASDTTSPDLPPYDADADADEIVSELCDDSTDAVSDLREDRL
jgi:hypothetical protein